MIRVKKEVTAIEETWTGRLDSLRASQDSLQTALKSVEEETVWQRQLAGLRAELSQEVQEATAELSKNIVACQGRLSSARLDTHDKMQALEERPGHPVLPSA
ncbi:unnamed protein product [Effrenium voratum]|uniref:Uncharacterized protein n=1 Tax=Effrenium voratum TaxID=2562239 RepID=A0AA36IXF6_9DINO|nr:unnamed protein product [Effrenium voratum]